MATVRATWRRTIQVVGYEPEVLELTVEQETSADDPAKDAADMNRALSVQGDALVAERMVVHGLKRRDEPGRPKPPDEPDPFVEIARLDKL